MEKYIFASFARKDEPTVKPILTALCDEGYSLFYGNASSDFTSANEEKIKSCAAFLCFISDTAAADGLCRNEFNLAIREGKKIISVFLSSADSESREDLPPYSAAVYFEKDYSGIYALIKAILESPILKEAQNRKSYSENKVKGEKYAYKDIINAKLYSTVKFGRYITFGIEASPLEWIVLDKQDSKVLLLSKYVIDCRDFSSLNWAESEINAWLNTEFHNVAFSREESEHIYEANERFSSVGGYSTVKSCEKIFLLSKKEVKKYFPLFKKRFLVGIPTEYALQKSIYTHLKASLWWIRDLTDKNYSTINCAVNRFMVIGWDRRDYIINDKIGVRPAIWVDCE